MKKTLILGIAFSMTVTSIRADQPVNMDDVMAAWKKRQEAAKNFRFTLEETVFYPTGSIRGVIDHRPANLKPKATTQTADGWFITCVYHVTVMPKGVYINHDEMIETADRFMEIRTNRISESGNKSMSMDRGALPGDPQVGRIRTTTEFSNAKMSELEEMMTALRGVNRRYTVNHIADYKPSGQRILHEGIEQFHFEEIRINPGFKHEIWLSPTQDWLPVRIDIDYTTQRTAIRLRNIRDDIVGWRPSQWTTTNYNDAGLLMSSAEYTVRNLEINAEPAKEETEIRFPAGIRVVDDSNGSSREYIAGTNGELIDSSRNAEADRQMRYSRQYIFWSIGIVVSALLLWISISRYRKMKRPF